jgi:hypothetical protein
MDVSHGNSLCNYLKQPKCHVFFFFFFYTKLEKRRMEIVLLEGVGTGGRGRMWGNGKGG